MRCSVDRFPAVAAFVAGSPRRWSDLHIGEDALLELCRTEDLSALCFYRLSQSAVTADWPPRVFEFLSETARVQAGKELLRGAETRAVLDTLRRAGLSPILIKGTPLAYTVYDAPALRPREDTDLLIAPEDVEAARRVLVSLGYSATVQCHDLFSQFEMQKVDGFGVCHAFDVHWKISTQPVFERVLTHGEMLPRARPVPALGPHAMTAGFVDALLLACIHPVMHHQNAERVLWAYDAHLLALQLTADDFDDFVRHARQKCVAAVCARQLQRAQTLFQTTVPADVLAALSAVRDEPSAEYLASQRRWHHELASSVRGLPRFGDRVKLLRDVLLPSPSYMLGAYGLRGKPLGPWLLPALYVHRNLRGAWKILIGKK
jgi:putative nucleotidyltransferase-like protein